MTLAAPGALGYKPPPAYRTSFAYKSPRQQAGSGSTIFGGGAAALTNPYGSASTVNPLGKWLAEQKFYSGLKWADAAPGLAQPPAGGPPGLDLSGYGEYAADMNADPVLASIRMAAWDALGRARSQAASAKERLALGLGSRDFASRILGQGYGGMGAISDEPLGGFSSLSQIAKAYGDAVGQAEEDINKANLFYGGWRGKTLNNLSYQKQQSIAKAMSDAEAAYAAIMGQETGAFDAYTQALINAIGDAYGRALNRPPKAPPGTTPPGAPSADDILAGIWPEYERTNPIGGVPYPI